MAFGKVVPWPVANRSPRAHRRTVCRPAREALWHGGCLRTAPRLVENRASFGLHGLSASWKPLPEVARGWAPDRPAYPRQPHARAAPFCTPAGPSLHVVRHRVPGAPHHGAGRHLLPRRPHAAADVRQDDAPAAARHSKVDRVPAHLGAPPASPAPPRTSRRAAALGPRTSPPATSRPLVRLCNSAWRRWSPRSKRATRWSSS